MSLHDFLHDKETLCELYKQLPNCSFLHKLAKRVHSSCRSRRSPFHIRSRAHAGEMISMTHVSDEVRHLLGSFTKPLYPPSTVTTHFNMTMDDSSASVSLFIRHLPCFACNSEWRPTCGTCLERIWTYDINVSEIFHFSTSCLKVRRLPKLHSGRTMLKHQGTSAETFSFGLSSRTTKSWLKLPGSR